MRFLLVDPNCNIEGSCLFKCANTVTKWWFLHGNRLTSLLLDRFDCVCFSFDRGWSSILFSAILSLNYKAISSWVFVFSYKRFSLTHSRGDSADHSSRFTPYNSRKLPLTRLENDVLAYVSVNYEELRGLFFNQNVQVLLRWGSWSLSIKCMIKRYVCLKFWMMHCSCVTETLPV